MLQADHDPAAIPSEVRATFMDNEAPEQKLEPFVESYFEELRRHLEKVRSDLQALEDKFASHVAAFGKTPILRDLVNRVEEGRRRDLGREALAGAFQELASAGDEESVLAALERGARGLAQGAVVLVRKGDLWIPFEEGQLHESKAFSASEDSVCRRAAEERATVAGESSSFPPQSLGSRPIRSAGYCAALPLVFGERVPVVLYADAAEEAHCDVVGLELLCQAARMAIRSAYFASRARLTAQPVRVSPEVQRVAPETNTAPPAPEAPPVRQAEPPISEYRIDFQRMRAPEGHVELAPASPPRPAQPPAHPPAEPAAHPQTHPDEGDVDLFGDLSPREIVAAIHDVQPVVQPVPEIQQPEAHQAPVVQPPPEAPQRAVEAPDSSPSPLTDEEEQQHADARRFARLLVSELKLYNEQSVLEGRQKGDLYLRLKSDIDRSREMYGRRVPAGVTRRADHFHDELVKLLAEGNAAALGADYPGSQAANP